MNLNFYTQDIVRSLRLLAHAGCEPWTDPVAYEVGRRGGRADRGDRRGARWRALQPGPAPKASRTRPVGEISRFLEERGTTRTGLSEVVTTAHSVRSIDAALRFYVDVLGYEVWLDAVFDRVDSNRLLSLADDARSRVTFVKGDHLFGKIALIEGAQLRACRARGEGNAARTRVSRDEYRSRRS